MRTYIADIIPKIVRFSQKLNNKTILENQQWVLVDEINTCKTVYIFRKENQLLKAVNGRITKGKWDYINNDALLIEFDGESILFKLGFYDENILALKIDSEDQYVFFINECNATRELNSIDEIAKFLSSKYLSKKIELSFKVSNDEIDLFNYEDYKYVGHVTSDKGKLQIRYKRKAGYRKGDKIYLNDKPAPDGKYKLGFLSYLIVKDGRII